MLLLYSSAISDLKLRDDNDDGDLEGVDNQEALEEAEIVSKGTKDDLEAFVNINFVYF